MLRLFFDFKKSIFSEKKKRDFIGGNSIFDIFIGNSCILACDERLKHRVLLKNKLDFFNFKLLNFSKNFMKNKMIMMKIKI